MSTRFPFTVPSRAPHDLEFIHHVLQTGRVQGDGEFTKRAHALLTGYLDGAPVLLTTSCTHALEMIGVLFDIQPGDEVVVPSFTFPSTATAMVLRGARLRFADIDPRTWSVELPQIQDAITPATKSVVAMAYGGINRDIAAIAAACHERGILLAEDAAHALFARQGGRALGTFGDLGALSFHATKNISSGEGGALIVNGARFMERAMVLREKGTDRARFLRGEVDKYSWRDVGSSWLPSDVLAAILCAQLENAAATQRRRQEVVAAYLDVLEPEAAELGLTLQTTPPGSEPPAHVCGVLVPDRTRRAPILTQMRDWGALCVTHYEPLHLSEAGRRFGAPAHLPVTEDVASRLVRLPLYSDLQPDHARSIATALLEVVRADASR